MTIVELMVVIAIIVMIIGLGVVGFGGIRSADVDTTGGLISGAMRYVHTLAIHNNKTYRLVLDIEGKQFYVEAADSEDPCGRYLPEEGADPFGGDEAEAARDLADAEGIDPAEAADAVAAMLAAKAEGRRGDKEGSLAAKRGGRFAKEDSALLSKKFQPETNVAGVVTEHHTSVQESGKAAIYFYPSGRAERALVYIGSAKDDSDENTYFEPEITIEMHPLGYVTRHGGVVDERDFLRQVEDELEGQ